MYISVISHIWQAVFIPRRLYQEHTSFIDLIRSVKELSGSMYLMMFNLYKEQKENVSAFEMLMEGYLMGYYTVDMISGLILGRLSLIQYFSSWSHRYPFIEKRRNSRTCY